jgi:hypothetical protein
MIQLPKLEAEGIQPERCGLLFLATPHSGTTAADWNNFLFSVAETFVGVRRETIQRLKSYNPMSAMDKEDFLKLTPCPSFRCLAEGTKMEIARTNQFVRKPFVMANTLFLLTFDI